MSITEEQAKTKWCPFARVYHGTLDSPAYNRRHDDELPSRASCLGSDCMAWRWDHPSQQPSGIGYASNGTPDVNGLGHCGLAGAP